MGQSVRLITDVDDGIDRQLGGLTLTAYRIPRGTVAGYYPECNILVPITHHDRLSKTPAGKAVPVRDRSRCGLTSAVAGSRAGRAQRR